MKTLLASRAHQADKTVIHVKERCIGGELPIMIAGPCTIESEAQLDEIAAFLVSIGVGFLRGGAFKPRTSPYDFQGLGKDALIYMQRVSTRYGLVSVSEVMDPQDVSWVAAHVDVLQIGSRNMQNYALLKAVGQIKNPVVLKRSFSATYQELLMSAEYILTAGNPNVILCERGIRTFEPHTRNTLDLTAVPVLKQWSHLPVIVDPSHGTGLSELVCPMAMGGLVVGADGLMIEVHPMPARSVSDARQALSFQSFAELMRRFTCLVESGVCSRC